MAWQNEFAKKFPVFPKIHAPLSHGKVLKCSWPLSLAKVRKQESTPLKEYARKEFVQLAQLNDVYFVQKREKEISKKLLTSGRFGGKLDLSSRGQGKTQCTLKIKNFSKKGIDKPTKV